MKILELSKEADLRKNEKLSDVFLVLWERQGQVETWEFSHHLLNLRTGKITKEQSAHMCKDNFRILKEPNNDTT